jgi:hypothetical protein
MTGRAAREGAADQHLTVWNLSLPHRTGVISPWKLTL